MTGKTAENGSVVWEGRWGEKDGKNVKMQNVYFTVDAPQVNPLINVYAQKNLHLGDDAYGLYFNTIDNGVLSGALAGANIHNMKRGETKSVQIPVEYETGSVSHNYMDIIKESESGYTVRMPTLDGDKTLLRDNSGRKMVFRNESEIRIQLGKLYAGNLQQ
jgi:hypothetical protein